MNQPENPHDNTSSLLSEFEPKKKKKRGKAYFYIGLILIALQLFSYMGGADKTPDQFTNSIAYQIGYNIFLIVGLILVIIGVKKGI